MHFFACLLRQENSIKCTTFFDTYFSIDRFSVSNCTRRSLLPDIIPAARCCSDIWQVGGSAGLLNADNRNKGATGFRQLQEYGSGLDCGISYAAMLLISCTIRSCSCSSSSKRKTCIKTFSVNPSDFAKSAGDTFRCFISENTISFAMATPPFYIPDCVFSGEPLFSLSSKSL